MESIPHHLTAACVSNDPLFTENILGNTVNGVTYHGMRARTTGAPQNHWYDSRVALNLLELPPLPHVFSICPRAYACAQMPS